MIFPHTAFLFQSNVINDQLDLYVKIVTIVGVIITLITALATALYRLIPLVKAKIESRSIEKSAGANLFTAENIERTIRYYVAPMCQNLDPAGAEEPKLLYAVKQKLFDALDDAIDHPTDYRYLFLLADSGMGKTSAFINYYARYLRRWRKKYKLALIPLGIPDADERIASIELKNNTVLLLDAFDEDTLAIIDHVERLRLILKGTQEFRQVFISCRTQFFSKEEEIPQETGILKVGSRAAGEPAEYFFKKIYLSPFSDKQVATYLKRQFPIWRWKRRRRAKQMVEKIPYLAVRPMLLAHIEDLVKVKGIIQYSFELYEEMIAAWLKREEGFIKELDNLSEFSELLAVDLYLNRTTRGAERIAQTDLSKLAQTWNIPLEGWKLTGRSLLNRDASGNYKFAHRSIMEYLFVKRAIKGDARCLEASWTDQMELFFWEMFQKNMAQKSGISLDRFWPLEHEVTPKGRLELVKKIATHGKELENSRLIRASTSNKFKTSLRLAFILTSWFLDPSRSKKPIFVFFNITNADLIKRDNFSETYILTLDAMYSYYEVLEKEVLKLPGLEVLVKTDSENCDMDSKSYGTPIWRCANAYFSPISIIEEATRNHPLKVAFILSTITTFSRMPLPIFLILISALDENQVKSLEYLRKVLLDLITYEEAIINH